MFVYYSGPEARFLGAGAHYLSSADDELDLVPGTQQEIEIAGKWL